MNIIKYFCNFVDEIKTTKTNSSINIAFMKRFSFLAIFLAFASGCVSCGEDDKNNSTVQNKNRNQQPNAQGWEVPHLKGDGIYINHTLADGTPNYCMEYVTDKYHTRWVAYRYDAKTAQRNTTRSDAWAADLALDGMPQYQIASHLPDDRVQTFSKYGYQRGHLVGSAERYYSKEANEQTFYMTNISPMIGAFNSDYWGYIEDICRDKWGRPCAQTGDTLYVVKGGTIDKTIGTCQLYTTNGSLVEMVVPQYYFMACVRRTKDNNVTGIAFLMEHKDYKDTSEANLKSLARKSAMSIDELEKKTGIDFFCNMPDNLEDKVESTFFYWQGL